MRKKLRKKNPKKSPRKNKSILNNEAGNPNAQAKVACFIYAEDRSGAL